MAESATAPAPGFDSSHTDTVHDAQFDYYGKFLATCSSDHNVKLFEVNPPSGNGPTLLATLTGHDGAVWQVSWAPPQYGHLLASCGYDHRVVVWKLVDCFSQTWRQVHVMRMHTSSVNAVAFGPAEVGLSFLSASSDETLALSTYSPETSTWTTHRNFGSHKIGCNAVAWAPSSHCSAESSIIASGGCDNKSRLWRVSNNAGVVTWTALVSLSIADWVRDVCFAPTAGDSLTLACCGQDGKVILSTTEGLHPIGADTEEDESVSLQTVFSTTLSHTAWRICFNSLGTVAGVSSGSGEVRVTVRVDEGFHVSALFSPHASTLQSDLPHFLYWLSLFSLLYFFSLLVWHRCLLHRSDTASSATRSGAVVSRGVARYSRVLLHTL